MKLIGPISAGLVLVVLLAAFRILLDPPILQDFRHNVFDQYQRLSPRPYQPVPVRIIDIDDESLARLGQWPWPRDLLAQLIERLGQLGSATIALDMVFAEPDRLSPAHLLTRWPELSAQLELSSANTETPLPDFDQILAQTIAQYPVVGGFALNHNPNEARPPSKDLALIGASPERIVPTYPGAVVNLPLLQQAFSGVGSFAAKRTDRDAVVRRIPLVQFHQQRLVPSLSLEALRVVQKANTIAVRSETYQNQAQLERIRVGAFEVPVNADGSFWLHYTDPGVNRRLPAWQILQNDVAELQRLAPLLNGHIVFIGTSGLGLEDFATTPLVTALPGVELHAQALEQMLSGWFLQRPFWAAAVETLFILILGIALVIFMPRIGPLWCAAVGSVALALALGSSWLAFTQYRLLLDPVFPALAVLVIYIVMSLLAYVRTELQRYQIRRAFAQYMAPQMLQQLEEDPKRLQLGGESREMTFLFTDIAGFTSLSENIPPEQLLPILNRYLDGACNVVTEHSGYINKIIGDAIFAIFNAPFDQADHAQRAVNCALALDHFSREFASELKQQNIEFGITRIGVNTGTATVGNFGGTRRFEYTALGDAVNTAARLESANKLLGTHICVAETTVAQCQSTAFRPLGKLLLRGKNVAVEAFEPLTATELDQPGLNDYLDAYQRLCNADHSALAAFQKLAETCPDDPVVSLHIQRLNQGVEHTTIQVS